MRELRQATSVDVPIGPFLDSTDGITAETGLTITQPDVRLKKNGANWAQKAAAQTLTHEENGFYEVTLDATDTDTLGLLRLAVFESGAGPVWEDFLVLAPSAWDAKYAATAAGVQITGAGYLGDLTTQDAFDFKFETRVAGVLTTLIGTPAVSVYKDNNTTEITTGVTLSVDFDSKTGRHNVRIDPTADGAFYSAGSNFTVWVSAGTVGGLSALGLIAAFSLRARAALMPATEGRTLLVASDGLVTANGVDGLTPDTISDEVQTRTIAAVTTVTDKDNYALSAAGIAAIWAAAVRTLTAHGTLESDMATLLARVTPTLPLALGTEYVGIITGTSTTTSLVDSGLVQTDANHWKDRSVIFTSGALLGQAKTITASATGSLTTQAFTQAPAVDDTFLIV
jgi:hypothetical protein